MPSEKGQKSWVIFYLKLHMIILSIMFIFETLRQEITYTCINKNSDKKMKIKKKWKKYENKIVLNFYIVNAIRDIQTLFLCLIFKTKKLNS